MNKKSKDVFPKTQTGISGLDEITEGGFPKGRSVLICGSAGSGKTLFGMQFLINGILEFNEPGVFMSFEESGSDLIQNVKSLGYDIEQLKAKKKLVLDFVRIEKSEIEETGEYDLEGLFIRLNYAIESIGAKRVVLDTIESIFGGLSNAALLRSEIRRLFNWLKEKGVTAIITGEKGDGTLTRQGLEEYVSDCVILLDFRVIDQIATRRLRIIKYRGSTHGTNEYPFLIDKDGISVLPVTSLKLDYPSSKKIISTGLPELDKFFSKSGIYKGASTLITGTAGTAKTILAGHYTASSVNRKERVLFFSFEESPDQLIRNMGTIGINFKSMLDSKLLLIHASRPSLHGLEMHLITLIKLIKEFKPGTVVIDPISSLITIGSNSEVRAMLIRLLDTLKTFQLNTFLTSLTHSASSEISDSTVDAVSSLADIWIKVENSEYDHNMNRSLTIIKARGLGHKNGKQHFVITNKGIQFKNLIK